MTNTAAQRIAEDIWSERDENIAGAQDIKWYVAEAELTERLSDEVYALLVAKLAAR